MFLTDRLLKIPFFNRQYDVIWDRNFEHVALPPQKMLSQSQLENCAFLIEQIGNTDKSFAQKQMLPADCMQIKFPYLKFESLWPSIDYRDPRNKPEPPKYPFGRFPQGDKLVTDMIRKNIPRHIIFEEYKKINILEHVDITIFHQSEMTKIRTIDDKCDIKIYNYISDNFRNERLFYMFAHPVPKALKKILLDILGLAGFLDNGKRNKVGTNDANEKSLRTAVETCFNIPANYSNIQVPIHPQICKYFNLSWAHAKSKYHYYDFGELTFWEYMKLYVNFDSKVQIDKEGNMLNKKSSVKPSVKSEKSVDMLKVIDQIQTSDPNSLEMLILEGEMNFRTGNIKDAEKIFLNILHVEPLHLDALNNLACIKILEKKWDEAETLLNKAFKLDPSCDDIIANLTIIKEMKNIKHAQKKLSEDAGLKNIQCITFPRSGHYLLERALHKYFGNKFHYCEFYSHCRHTPCTDPLTNFQKNHDFGLKLPITDSDKYIIQYRNPIASIISWYRMHVWYLQNPETASKSLVKKDCKDEWLRFLNEQIEYWRGFVHKWVIDNLHPSTHWLKYEDLIGNPKKYLKAVVKYMMPGEKANVQMIAAIINELDIRSRSDINKFKYYDAHFFEEIEKKVNREMEILKLK